MPPMLAPTEIYCHLVNPVVVDHNKPAFPSLWAGTVLPRRVTELDPQAECLQRGAHKAQPIPSLLSKLQHPFF
jgi:hypothetical protein